ncbi:MAG: tetratricopeptide repeat protein [Candidatus Nitrohelix vancouverensis]|uniref:Tetratricopeptide repeat protein n=1 Tax=Candidatus Nitrohelix vancouverensis TaxID=2705534 RepID=A0A7T0G464_9BACT|nr:MAG: tetratricopeptide repeat protein [Candidatus Nitrohelix vancouverensis]
MSLSRKISHLFLIAFLVTPVFLQGCSYIPWIGDDQEEDIVFEDDFGTEGDLFGDSAPASDDDSAFFAEDSGDFLDVDGEFANPDQATAKGELKGDVENLQFQQESLVAKVRQLEEILRTLEPKISATEQRLEGSLAAAQGKTEFLEPEVEQLKSKVETLNAELTRVREMQTRAQEMEMQKSAKRRSMHRASRAQATPPEYQRALAAYRAKNYDESILLFQSLSVSNPPSSLRDNIVFWIGSNYLQLEMYDDAIQQFETVLNKYPNGNKVHDSRYMLGLSYYKKGESSKAVEILQAALRGNPTAEVRGKIQKKLQEIQ